MLNFKKKLLPLLALQILALSVSLPVWSQETKPEQKQDTAQKDTPPETEEQKRLKAKYPLSINGKTLSNQKANQLMQTGIQQYYITRDMFTAANEISSTYSEADHELKVEQKGVIKARLQPQDLLNYGPQYAYIGLRIRALQDAEALVTKAIGNFSQARSLAPSVSVIPKWLKVAQDTKQAIRYHIQFYKTSVKAVQMGYDKQVIDALARVWKAPHDIKPETSLTTRVNTHFFELLEKQKKGKSEKKESKEKIDLDSFKDTLPNLDFEIKDF